MGSGDNIYDRSKAPKEGVSSISARTRQRLYGRPEPQNFGDWYAQQQRGPAQGPVRTNQASAQPNDFYAGNAPTLTLDNQQQLLSNMFNPQAQQWPGGGGNQPGSDQDIQKLKMWIDFLREKQATDINQNPERVFQAASQASDPVQYAQENYQARLASDPWAPGGQFEGHRAADVMTPAQIMASQGRTAANQWASQLPAGASTKSGVDADELRRLNAQQAGRYKTYI